MRTHGKHRCTIAQAGNDETENRAAFSFRKTIYDCGNTEYRREFGGVLAPTELADEEEEGESEHVFSGVLVNNGVCVFSREEEVRAPSIA
jgi:hypothetical protein